MPYEKNVFVNCPFDEEYFALLRPLLFTIIYLDFNPRIALEKTGSEESRLEKIIGLIRESKFGIHDLSRCESLKAGEIYRLNMPFELGLDFGCLKFGRGPLREKRILILEALPHRYKAALSDLSGADIEVHNNDPYRVIGNVRNWFHSVGVKGAPGVSRIEGAFSEFMAANSDALTKNGFSARDIQLLPLGELMGYMREWKER